MTEPYFGGVYLGEWQPHEVEALKTGLAEGLTDRELAQRIGRTEYAVHRKRTRAGYLRSIDRSKNLKWTDALDGRLKKLAALKWSYGKIAEDMGLTRGAVIGRAFRLGFPSRKESKINYVRLKPAPKKREFFQAPVDPIVPMVVAFLDLEPHHCRYPLDSGRDPATHYCGNPKHGDKSWCIGHCGICFALSAPRRPGRGFGIFK